MAAPTFIGAGNPVYGSASGWPASLTVTSADAPSGVVAGDRLVLFVSVSYGRRTFPTPADDTLGGFDGLSTWTALTPATFTASGGVSTAYWQLWAFTIRHASTLYPFSVAPRGTTSGTSYTPILSGGIYRAQLFAWRPSAAFGASSAGSASNTATLLPNPTMAQSLTNVDGLLVAAAAMPATGTIGSLSTARSFTERFDQTPITNRGGSLKVADYTPGSTVSFTGPQWTKPTTDVGVAMLIAFNDPDPSVTSVNEWGVDQVRW